MRGNENVLKPWRVFFSSLYFYFSRGQGLSDWICFFPQRTPTASARRWNLWTWCCSSVSLSGTTSSPMMHTCAPSSREEICPSLPLQERVQTNTIPRTMIWRWRYTPGLDVRTASQSELRWGRQFQIGSLVMGRQLEFNYFLSTKFISPPITKGKFDYLLEFSMLYSYWKDETDHNFFSCVWSDMLLALDVCSLKFSFSFVPHRWTCFTLSPLGLSYKEGLHTPLFAIRRGSPLFLIT